jgi:hypothetical protein
VYARSTFRRRYESSDEEKEDKDAEYDAQPLDQVHVRDLHSFGGPHAKYHRYSDNIFLFKQGEKGFHVEETLGCSSN